MHRYEFRFRGLKPQVIDYTGPIPVTVAIKTMGLISCDLRHKIAMEMLYNFGLPTEHGQRVKYGGHVQGHPYHIGNCTLTIEEA